MRCCYCGELSCDILFLMTPSACPHVNRWDGVARALASLIRNQIWIQIDEHCMQNLIKIGNTTIAPLMHKTLLWLTMLFWHGPLHFLFLFEALGSCKDGTKGRIHNVVMKQRQRIVRKEDTAAIRCDARLSVLQFNAGSVVADLNEFISITYF